MLRLLSLKHPTHVSCDERTTMAARCSRGNAVMVDTASPALLRRPLMASFGFHSSRCMRGR
jgi:hypothetical protein